MEDPKVRMMKITEEFIRDIAEKAMETDTKTTSIEKYQGRRELGIFIAVELKISLDGAFCLISSILRMYAKTISEEEMVIRTRNLFLSLS